MKLSTEKLLAAYSEQNLTALTSKIIQLYKTGQSSALTQVARIVSDFTKLQDGNINKIFSQLIMLIHPDRSNRILQKINNHVENQNFTALHPYLFILELDDIDDLIVRFGNEEDVVLDEEEVWEDAEDDYDYFDEDNDYNDFDFEEPQEFDFYTAVKRKIYGHQKVNFPVHYLEDFEEIEMSKSGITDLSGVEHCKYVKKLYLNNNDITDISELLNLENIEELYIARNQIGFIDALESLENLRILDISYNQIDDLTPIIELNKLEFVNAIGNNIPKEQIIALKNNNIIVIA